MYSEDAKIDRPYRGNQAERNTQEKHVQLLDAISRLAAFHERLTDFHQRLVGEQAPVCGVGGRGETPSLAYTLDQSPREINEIVDRLSKQLDSIITVLYG